MKNIILIIITLIISNFAFASSLTSNQKQQILTATDNLCGDSWCEGDFDFSFNEVDCDFEMGICTMDITLFSQIYELTYKSLSYNPTVSEFNATCVISGFNNYKSIVENYRGYEQLTHEFYEELSDCITAQEESFYDILED